MRHIQVGAAVIAAGLGAGIASGDVVSAWYVNPFSFSYEVAYMPDLDQRRYPGAGVWSLPNDGNMFCVPTSAVNLMAYAANHGFPSLSPLQNDWQHPGTYNIAGEAIELMGSYMGTDPVFGTDGAGGWNGTLQWIGWQDLTLTGDSIDVDAHYVPSLAMLAQRGVNGGIVQFGYGVYDAIDTAGDPIILDDRPGGHAVTLAEAKYIGATRTLGSRDPADEPDFGAPMWQTTQSPFSTNYYDVGTESVRFQCFFPDCIINVTTLNWTEGDEQMVVLDGILTVNPKAGYSWQESGGVFEVNVYTPNVFYGHGHEPLQIVPLPFDPICVLMDHDQLGFYAMEFGQVWHVRRSTGEPVDLPIGAGYAECMALGRQRQMYVYGDGLLEVVAADDPDWQPFASTFTPDLASAMAFDDVNDELLLISHFDGSLMIYDKQLEGAPQTMNLPWPIPLDEGMDIAIAPGLDGNQIRWWFSSPLSNTIWGLHPTGDWIELSVPGGSSITSISFDDANNLHAVVDGQVREFQHTGFNSWTLLASGEGYFQGQAVNDRFEVTRSRNNYDPELHGSWVNIDADDVVKGEIVLDCRGDLNGDRVVDVQDILQLLGDWGPCNVCLSDLNGDRVIDVSDILVLLGNWGDCD